MPPPGDRFTEPGFTLAPGGRSLGADDFSFFGSVAPLAMAFVGLEGAPGFEPRALHHPEFLPPDEAVVWVAQALTELHLAGCEATSASAKRALACNIDGLKELLHERSVTLRVVVWHLLIYRLPATPSRARVAAWRELRRLGALPLQQSVAAIPDVGDLRPQFDRIEQRIREEDGRTYRFRLADLHDEQQRELVDAWNALRAQEYAEIVEECETKFEREVEFELFRENLTAAEAEELEADLDKIKRWFGNVAQRDVFGTPERAAAEQAIGRCEEALEAFVERVFHAEQEEGPSLDPPAPMSWGEGVPETRAERERLAKQVTRLPARSRDKRPAEGEGA